VPVFHGRRGHPVLLRASCAGEIMALPAWRTARDVLQPAAPPLARGSADSAILDDIDRPAAYVAMA